MFQNIEISAAMPFSLAPSLLVRGFRLSVPPRPPAAITTFDAPGAGIGLGQSTEPYSVNTGGSAAGNDSDRNVVNHGFLRAAGGNITTFDVPGAGAGDYQSTENFGINQTGVIAGYYADANTVSHQSTLGKGRTT